ncbi:MAG: transcription termination/antitermination protein NusG [Synergistetes bacterium]|nr:transcription termination/antitermination protein NusG [Synergistota bacterium]
MEKEKRWYVVHTYSGYENKVKANIEQRVSSMKMEDKIFQIIVPTETRITMKNGKRKIVKRKIFPGYILVEMIMDDNSWNLVRYTPGVMGFAGTVTKPVPLSDEEVKNLLIRMGMGDKAGFRIDVEVGENVRIIDGPFKEIIGKVDLVMHDKGKVRVTVNMFGRETPVELDFMQIEKL